MKKHFVSVLALLLVLCCHAQKPVLDLKDLAKGWPGVSSDLSNDGKYVANTFYNLPKETPIEFISTRTNWKMKVFAQNSSFTQDSKMAIFSKAGDTLGILKLGTSSIEYIAGVKSFKMPVNGTGKWLAYQLATPQNELVLRNLATGKLKTFASIKEYQFSDNGKVLLLQVSEGNNATALQWIDLPGGSSTTIWEGDGLGALIFDQHAKQLAFTVDDKQAGRSFWYYKPGADKAILLASNQASHIDNGLLLNDIQRFSKDGSKLFCDIMEKPFPVPAKAAKVNVWSYADPKLQSQQLYELKDHGWGDGGPRKYAAVINVNTHLFNRLEQQGDEIQTFWTGLNDKYTLLLHDNGGNSKDEWNWSKPARTSVYIVSTVTGHKKLLLPDYPSGFYGALNDVKLSPSGKYVIYYDHTQKNYFSYDIASGTIKNITKEVHTTWTSYDRDDEPVSDFEAIGVAGWLPNDESVLISDQYDIWQIDPSGIKPPVNLTNGYGNKHHIVFQPLYFSGDIFKANSKIILNAFNRDNKDNGFYSVVIGSKKDPQLLIMQPYVFAGLAGSENAGGHDVKKARYASVYMVSRQSAAESENHFLTTDFKTYKPITDFHPEKNYNWLTSELITWQTPDGNTSQGILYKPENFNPSKKYPVIFTYYERSSDGLHTFPYTSLCYGPIAPSLAYYVSNGYLVFMPDIHSKVGYPGRAACNTIVSAAKYLSALPFIDGRHMGIQGQSFGGFETDYVITHSDMFAAACSTSGMTNFSSAYGTIIGGGGSRQMQYELYRDRIGASLWERPDLYIENSPVFRAYKVTTPLLMMANAEDDDVPWQQGIEFFTALRRLGKKVWMLQYDGEGHMLMDDKNETDLTIRMKQFFDYYLMGKQAPKWMVQGIPAKSKGFDDGLELMPEGVRPGPNLLTPEEQKKVDDLMKSR